MFEDSECPLIVFGRFVIVALHIVDIAYRAVKKCDVAVDVGFRVVFEEAAHPFRHFQAFGVAEQCAVVLCQIIVADAETSVAVGHSVPIVSRHGRFHLFTGVIHRLFDVDLAVAPHQVAVDECQCLARRRTCRKDMFE